MRLRISGAGKVGISIAALLDISGSLDSSSSLICG
jgi:hypothetical protein